MLHGRRRQHFAYAVRSDRTDPITLERFLLIQFRADATNDAAAVPKSTVRPSAQALKVPMSASVSRFLTVRPRPTSRFKNAGVRLLHTVCFTFVAISNIHSDAIRLVSLIEDRERSETSCAKRDAS